MAAKPRGESWSQQDLENAMRAIERGEGISVREASKRFGIPRRMLPNHISSGSTEKRLGRKSLLGGEEEQMLVDRIIRFANLGLPLTAKMIRCYVFDYFEVNNRQHPFTCNLAGEKWFRLFLKRHPQLRHRKAQAMNPARAQKLNRFIVIDHFTKLEHILTDHDLFNRPDRIFNLDEKGCRLSLHHQQRVIAQKGSKRVHLVAPEHGENVTVAACVSAVGGAIPPMIIYKGKNKKQHFGDDLPPLACFEMAEKGSMTNELFVKWLQHFSKFKPQGKVLLIFDGAKCHLSIDIVDEADRHDVTLFCLPSNTTHELQPLDVAVFRSFEHHWDQEVLSFWRNRPERVLSKEMFGKTFTSVWTKCMTMANIQSGFRKCGIYPFNKDAIPEYAFAPSDVTHMDATATDDGATPQPSISQDASPSQPSTSQQAPPQLQPANEPHLSCRPANEPHLSRRPANKPHLSRRPANGPHLSHRPANGQHLSHRPANGPHLSHRPASGPHLSHRQPVGPISAVDKPTGPTSAVDKPTSPTSVAKPPRASGQIIKPPKLFTTAISCVNTINI